MSVAGVHCLVTGPGGFVGRALLARLAADSIAARPWGRSQGFDLAAADTPALREQWLAALRGAEVVVHLAARVHQMQEAADGDLLHQRINSEGTARLARLAAVAGVRRFVFLSTAKVFGEGGGDRYSSVTPAAPADPYARSKWQAEQQLQAIAAETGMEVVVIRPPLVYGPGVGANFRSLWRLAALPLPLPLGAVDNRRDLIAIDNLIDVIVLALTAPVAGRVLPCSDGDPCSTAQLVARIRAALGRPAMLFPLPLPWLSTLLDLGLGVPARERLLGNFELDISDTRRLLGWQPRFTMDQTFARMREARQ